MAVFNCKNADDVLKAVKDYNVSFIQFWFIDVLGVLKSFQITPRELENAFEEGMGFDGSSITGFTKIQESDMVGFFASPDFGGVAGLFYGGGMAQVITQVIGVGAVFIWAFGTGLIAFGLLKATIGIRVTEEEELKGLDITEHGSEAYSGFQIFITE